MKSEEMILKEIETIRRNMNTPAYTTIDSLQGSARIRGLLWAIDDNYPSTVALKRDPDVWEATRLEKIEQVIDAVHKE